jgi:hypothetical protein
MMKAKIRKALVEFGPCSVRDLYDYLRSTFAIKRGLYCPRDLTINGIRTELEAIVGEEGTVAKFQCTSGTKVRYGITQFTYYSPSEQRFLSPRGSLHTCVDCAFPIFECDGRSFHLPARCDKNVPQDYFKIMQYKDEKVILSNDFVYGIIENAAPCTLRLTKEFKQSGTNRLFSELWYINQQARSRQLVPPDRLLPLKTKETTLE